MAVEIKVPDMGESVIEATIARWIKQEGEQVSAGEPLVELETDKINLEVGAQQAGVLQKINRQPGDTVAVGDVLGIVDPGGAESKGGSITAPPSASKAAASAPEQAQTTAPAGTPAAQAGTPTSPSRAETEARMAEAGTPVEGAPPTVGTPSTGTPAAKVGTPTSGAPATAAAATPLAQRMADDRGVDLSRVTPTGSGGRITKEDVEAYLQNPPAAAPAAQAAAAPAPAPAAVQTPASTPAAAVGTPTAIAGTPATPTVNGREERVRMSRRRQTIARRLVEAQHTAAMLTTFNEIDLSAVMALRKRRREGFKERYGVDLGYMSFFVKASIGALKAFPNVNAEISGAGDEIIRKHYYDIGVAIGAEEGLVVPVIRDADRLNFAGIEKAIKDFAAKVKAGTLTLEDLRGGTFTITNGGVYGSLMSTPILNPPQVGILGMHAIKERAVVIDGAVVARPMMYVALSYDHRIVDGREAVQFLVRIKELVEDPEALLFG